MDELLTVKEYMKLTKRSQTQAYEDFKNKDFARRGILVKITEVGKNGGWRINKRRLLEWSGVNAKMELKC